MNQRTDTGRIDDTLKSEGTDIPKSSYSTNTIPGYHNLLGGVSSIYSEKYPTQSQVDDITTNEDVDGYFDGSMNPGTTDSQHPTNEQLLTWQSVFKKLNDFQNSSIEVSRIIDSFSNKMASLLLNTIDKIHEHTPKAMFNGLTILTTKESLILAEMASEENEKIC